MVGFVFFFTCCGLKEFELCNNFSGGFLICDSYFQDGCLWNVMDRYCFLFFAFCVSVAI